MADRLIKFSKYHGLGNDFILTHVTVGTSGMLPKMIQQFCQRRLGVGADGYVELHQSSMPGCEFRMDYYNSEGKLGTLCGSGARCAVDYGRRCGLFVGNSVTFEAVDGSHDATINIIESMVTLQTHDVTFIKKYDTENFFVNTGSPHHIRYVTDLSTYPVITQGREIMQALYGEVRPTIDFVQTDDNGAIHMRSYESTVKEETILATGTGSTAVAIVAHFKTVQFDSVMTKGDEMASQSVRTVVKSEGGEAVVSFTRTGECTFSNVTLTGPICHVYDGTWHC